MISFSRFFGSHFFLTFLPSLSSLFFNPWFHRRQDVDDDEKEKAQKYTTTTTTITREKIKQQQSNKHACTLFWLWLRLANTLLHTNYFHTTPESHINISRKEFSTTNHRHHQEQNRITHYYSLISPFLIWCTCATSSTQLFAVKQQ